MSMLKMLLDAEWIVSCTGFQKNVAVRLLAAGLAATALVAAPSIADAKVILEQPKVKKVGH